MIMYEMWRVLRKLKCPIRIPTACWLFSDMFNLIDDDVRQSLVELQDLGHITIDNGGWITCK